MLLETNGDYRFAEGLRYDLKGLTEAVNTLTNTIDKASNSNDKKYCIWIDEDCKEDSNRVFCIIEYSSSTEEEIQAAINRAKEKHPGEYTSDDVWDELPDDCKGLQINSFVYW